MQNPLGYLKQLGALTLLLVALTWPGQGQPTASLLTTGELLFPSLRLNGLEQEITASQVPQWNVDLLQAGLWSLHLQVPRQPGSAEVVSWAAGGGSLLRLDNQNLDVGAWESSDLASLEAPLAVVRFRGPGRWRYQPSASQFRLRIQAESRRGDYRLQLIATLRPGN